jgi:hypothetical protein
MPILPSARIWLFLAALLPLGATAEDKPAPELLGEITLDIDGDGKADRAVLVRNEVDSLSADLSIYLDGDTEPGKLSRKPTILVESAIYGPNFFELSSNGSSLIVNGRCGGCSDDYDTTLTIVHRDGKLVVGGLTRSWETNDGAGSCAIDFLAGKGTMSHGLAEEAEPIDTKFEPIDLADWSQDRIPEACQP